MSKFLKRGCEYRLGRHSPFFFWRTEEDNIFSKNYYITEQSIPIDTFVPVGTLVRLKLSPVQP